MSVNLVFGAARLRIKRRALLDAIVKEPGGTELIAGVANEVAGAARQIASQVPDAQAQLVSSKIRVKDIDLRTVKSDWMAGGQVEVALVVSDDNNSLALENGLDGFPGVAFMRTAREQVGGRNRNVKRTYSGEVH